MGILVFISVLLVAACGLIYELVAGTLASYLVVDRVFQFSTIIGTYLFAMGIVRDLYQFRDVIAHVLTFDYLGALGASLLFPILLVPRLGLVRSAMLFGFINAGVALWSTFLFANQLSATRRLRVASLVVLCALGAGLAEAKQITATAEDNIYADEIIFARDTHYQHLVLTRFKDDLRLFLNSHLQFSSRDEYRYHEALVHPGLAAVPAPRRVLILG